VRGAAIVAAPNVTAVAKTANVCFMRLSPRFAQVNANLVRLFQRTHARLLGAERIISFPAPKSSCCDHRGSASRSFADEIRFDQVNVRRPGKGSSSFAHSADLQNERGQLIERVDDLQAHENERSDHQIDAKMHESPKPNVLSDPRASHGGPRKISMPMG